MTNAATAIAADLSQALRTMPKAELHVHIEGTLEPELALALAEPTTSRCRGPIWRNSGGSTSSRTCNPSSTCTTSSWPR